jgi:hypothetical protein
VLVDLAYEAIDVVRPTTLDDVRAAGDGANGLLAERPCLALSRLAGEDGRAVCISF